MSERIDPNAHFVPNYGSRGLTLVKGRGLIVMDAANKEYLDFGSGIAVNVLGYGDEKLAEVIAVQAKNLLHVSNLYHSPPAIVLAKHLTQLSRLSRVFFSNSGTEANEAAIKFVLKWRRHRSQAGQVVANAPRILCFEGAFHGRTLGSLSASFSKRYREAFEPLLPHFEFLPFGDLEAVKEALTAPADAILIEPIQGEGGVRVAPDDYFKELSDLCEAREVLLVMDEVQCGLGRLGALFASNRLSARPQIITLAKPLAGGLPIGATLVCESVAQCIEAGDHGSTFGANPLSCAAANHVIERLTNENIPGKVLESEDTVRVLLQRLVADHPSLLSTFRGMGFLWAIDTVAPAADIISHAREEGLLILSAGSHTLRIAPPLIATQSDWQAFDLMLRRALCCFESRSASGSPG